MSKLCPKIILEGTRLTGKTEIAFDLNEHPRIVGQRRYRYHSPIVSAEWCGFTNTPWGRGLINFGDDETGLAMETYATWARLFEQLRYYSWIVDRFHLSTRVWQQVHRERILDFRWLEERLVAIGFRIVLCVRDPASFAAARSERLSVSGNPSQYDDLAAFVHEQELFERAASESLLPTLRIDVTDGDRKRVCEEIADWLEETGGLTADY
jgi:hypothetical protein